ncbi:hypothetical protein BO79DRAFT_160370 [Aspergillus costaricaensis CBS 115574]|uniref:Uncharacterized protein n=1 Tax=Aspergillus costaricaensis CBS 115574 TaxID=1448317 RepID=A0ACD1I1E5_9EURO|nr:hypothetical protein BO79DRAFT_160370 [Aspergillus costaricaensis CBS 115574]RAK83591.1 hypothetical protein BO79DRAFT_160370 [Aspergillus costaricaensis CBS 115574]
MAEAVDANAALLFWQKLDPSHAWWLFLVIFVIVICNALLGVVRLYKLLIKRHHIRKLRAMPPSRRRDVEVGMNEEKRVQKRVRRGERRGR